jgi:exodeoxyribonuclease III
MSITNLKIVSWNINSIRLRIEMVVGFLQNHQPDIVCFQEIKCEENLFPYAYCHQAGYEYHYVSGQKSYNGVAIISKTPLSDIDITPVTSDTDGSRFISARLANGVILKNYYIPAGGDIPNESDNIKFKHKMDFVRSLITTANPQQPQIILGDFNIAPYEHDVWSHKQLLDVVSHTPQEVSALNDFKQAGDFCDIARHFHSDTEKLYSWWSYRAKDWQASNRGRRLDHIWCSRPLVESIKSFTIYKEYRGYEQPSDHVPIAIEYGV